MGTSADRTAEELFAEFAKTGRQEPFEEIVRRYSPMVFSVCYQVTHNTHDAEDATQAVFLSLAIQGKTGGQIRHMGPWLQRVAQRVSLNLNRGRKRRIAREEAVGQINGNGHGNGKGHARSASDPLEVEELRPLLTHEINQLPLKYRLPLILHYFGGMDRHEIARELKCKVATLTVRIHRGRRLLRSRLVQRGVAVGGGAIFAGAIAQAIQWQVSESFVTTTTYAATGLAAGHDVGGIVSMQVLALARAAAAGATAMAHGKLALAALLIAATTVTAGAAAVGSFQHGDLRLPAPQDLLPRIDLLDRLKPLTPRVEATPQSHDAGGVQQPAHVATASQSKGPLTPAGPSADRWQPTSVALATANPKNGNGIPPALPALSSMLGADGPLTPQSRRAVAVGVSPKVNAAIAPALSRPAHGIGALSQASSPAWHVDLPEQSRIGMGPQQWIGALARGSSEVGTIGISTAVGVVDDRDSTPKPPPPPRPRVNVALAPQRYFPPAVVTGTTGPLVFGQTNGRANYDSDLGQAIYLSAVGSSYSVNGGFLAQPLPTVTRGQTTLSGWGDAGITGMLDQSGRVIADGYGIDRVLDLSDVQVIHNSVDNPADHGLNGWFAKSHGELVLPPIHITGSGSYNWGESPTDATIDLVNSVRLTLNDVTRGGALDISLLALDNRDVPTLPGGHRFIGVWSFDPGSVRMDSVDLLLRYDDGLAQSMHLDESILKLWVYDDGAWSRITDSSFGRDTQNHLIWGNARSPEYFAVSAPEPSGVLLFGIGAGALLLRRRRRRID